MSVSSLHPENVKHKIAVITYERAHRKTQDLVFRLISLGYSNIHLFALPFVERKKKFSPVFSHRPASAIDVEPKIWANHLNLGYTPVTIENINSKPDFSSADKILIAGAGLLPAHLVRDHDLINSHPAFLPKVRGLDALKWAIVQKLPIAVTTHIVDEHADAGYLIAQKQVPIYAQDTFYHVAVRQYELEIAMLADTVNEKLNRADLIQLPAEGSVNKRMPASIEKDLIQYFEAYKKDFAV